MQQHRWVWTSGVSLHTDTSRTMGGAPRSLRGWELKSCVPLGSRSRQRSPCGLSKASSPRWLQRRHNGSSPREGPQNVHSHGPRAPHLPSGWSWGAAAVVSSLVIVQAVPAHACRSGVALRVRPALVSPHQGSGLRGGGGEFRANCSHPRPEALPRV